MLVCNFLAAYLIFFKLGLSETALSPTDVKQECQLDGWHITINVTSFGHGVKPSTSNQVNLGKKRCTGVLNHNHMLVFHYPYTSCGTTVETPSNVVLFRNVMYLDPTKSTGGAKTATWIINLACIVPRDQRGIIRYTRFAKILTSASPTKKLEPTSTTAKMTPLFQYTSESSSETTPPTLSTILHKSTTTTPVPVTRSTVRTTDKTTQYHSTSQTVTPARCNICSGPLCGILPQTEKVIRCPHSTPYCINSIKNNENGRKTIVKKCVNKRDCERLWWQNTSDLDVCVKFNSLITYDTAFECHYCCVTDECNRDTFPKEKTLFQGAS